MAILALLAFFSGPFGTFLFMDEPVRLVYWSLKILILGVVATFFFAFIEVQKTSNLMAIIALSVGFGALAGFVTMLICLALGQPIEDLETIFWIFFYIGPSSSGVFVALYFLLSKLQPRPVAANAQPDPQPALYRRLKQIDHSSHILSLSPQDHYVAVRSEAGTELCLLRLRDAVDEMQPVDGYQIHRSHWVALGAIDKLSREGRAYRVILTDGSSLPVSANKVKALKERLNAQHLAVSVGTT